LIRSITSLWLERINRNSKISPGTFVRIAYKAEGFGSFAFASSFSTLAAFASSRPAASSRKLRVETACGITRTVPRRRVGIGAVTSSIRMVRALPSHSIPLGPICRKSGPRCSAVRGRSVIAQRRGAPYSATFMQQWFSGSPAPQRRDQAYQGEKTVPMKAMMVMPCFPSSLSASTYHQA